ncbi:MAG: GGDEF domain-containing protein [Butyrivibrio sp.]|uniref:GGDEF domain-containing protein n=1 Tax=Butyrivibrio sp. TaxID=28121 RepID=UPI001B7016F8|nr:GGDEF domain-containing protein [Butyrivibrio sp.]MBP3782425.1 GGDEF domain-containing protein [Butyrivibrio sp.]
MKNKPFMSLKLKLSIGVVVICLLIGVLAVVLVNAIAADIVDKEYMSKAEQMTKAVVTALDPEDVKELTGQVMGIYENVDTVVSSDDWGSSKWKEYMDNYEGIEQLPVYHRLRKKLRTYQDIFQVNCFYIMQFNVPEKHAIYIIDGAYENICPPGCVDSYEDGFWPDEAGYSVPTTITNEDAYGWLVSAGSPVMLDGKVIAYVCVDISMNEIKGKALDYVLVASTVMVIITVLLLGVSLWQVSRNVVEPVVLLTNTAKNYCSESTEAVHHAFEKLEVRNNDEISQLLLSMKQMEKDMNANINALMDAKVAIEETEKKANTMEELAVKDTLTGVWNRRAYEEEIQMLEEELSEGLNEFGIAMIDLNFLKKINDTYGHENGNITIRKLSGLICDIFKRSQVFRIGGDEFVVILKNKDYKKIDKRIENFNYQLWQISEDSSLKPWEKISAAIGYAKFDKDLDKTVNDVFKRADRAMYDRKVAMKANRDY